LPRTLLVVGVIAFVAECFETDYLRVLTSDERNIAFGAAAAVAISAAAKAEWVGSIRSPRWLSLLGDASYSLYLIHYPLLAIIAKIWPHTALRVIPNDVAFMMAVSTCVAAGLLIHKFIERSLINRLRKLSANDYAPLTSAEAT
jgi:peptidoglycan/LPS O-acetylase OafA/YrhL